MSPNSPPRLSVLLPVRDAAPWLAASLASLARQTEPGYELIAVDDGSRDESGEILEAASRRDPRIVVRHTSARGPPAPPHPALSLAPGPRAAPPHPARGPPPHAPSRPASTWRCPSPARRGSRGTTPTTSPPASGSPASSPGSTLTPAWTCSGRGSGFSPARQPAPGCAAGPYGKRAARTGADAARTADRQ